MLISQSNFHQYRRDGYMIIENFLSPAELELLRDECQNGIEMMHRKMDAAGTDVITISHRNKRYHISDCVKERPGLQQFVFGEKMESLVRETVGKTVFLFQDQFVVKAADQGLKLGWHQDAGYLYSMPEYDIEVKPYLTCWLALDDVSEANGTVYVLPYNQAGRGKLSKHTKEEKTNDYIGYNGDDPGIPAICPAGSLVAFSSHTFHRSGANQTDKMRRAMVLQYSPEQIILPDGTVPFMAEPFLKDGLNVTGVSD